MLVSLFAVALTTGQLPLESSSLDLVISICRSLEFPSDKLLAEISRVLKPGGTVLITGIKDGVIILQLQLGETSVLVRDLIGYSCRKPLFSANC